MAFFSFSLSNLPISRKYKTNIMPRSLAHSTTAASGQLALGGDATGPSSSSLDASNDKVFARRPVMGGSAASVPSVSTLERSKSQLALLLEKNRGKDGGGSGSRRK